jgi:hypothetical protein
MPPCLFWRITNGLYRARKHGSPHMATRGGGAQGRRGAMAKTWAHRRRAVPLAPAVLHRRPLRNTNCTGLAQIVGKVQTSDRDRRFSQKLGQFARRGPVSTAIPWAMARPPAARTAGSSPASAAGSCKGQSPQSAARKHEKTCVRPNTWRRPGPRTSRAPCVPRPAPPAPAACAFAQPQTRPLPWGRTHPLGKGGGGSARAHGRLHGGGY